MSTSPQLEALLKAGRAERCPEGNEQRLLDALGASAPTPSSVVLGTSLRTLLRWMGLMVLLGMVPVGLCTIGARGPRLAETIVPPVAILADAPLAVARVTLSGVSVPERGAKSEPVHVARRSLPAAPSAIRAAPAVTSAVVPVDDELTRVTEARLALRRHDPAAALAALDAYDRAFPRGVFREEAAVLRVDSLVAAGRLTEAGAVAERFSATYPHSPYGPRVDTLRRRLERPE